MLRAVPALLLAAIFLVSCSKSESKKFSVSPQINIKSIDGRCLDLQSAVQQMDHPEFNFPGFVYTRNFEVMSTKIRPEYADSLTAKSFRARNANFRGLPDLRGAQQQGCEKVILTDFGGRAVTYNIVSFSKNYLELEFDKPALEQSLEEMSVHHKKQLSKTPTVKKIIVTIPAPTEIEVVSEYNAVPSECYNSTSLTLREEAVYGWADSSSRVAQAARINPAYWEKLNRLAATSAPKPEEPKPEEPGPVEDVPIVPLPAPALTGDAATMDLTMTSATVTGLKSYAHPRCF